MAARPPTPSIADGQQVGECRVTYVTTSERFRRFLAAIEPTNAELEAAFRRAQRIQRRLEDDFVVRRPMAVGSHWKGTAVRRISDLDLFVVFAREEARKWSLDLSSATLVRRVRNSVAKSYPDTTIRVDQQAVVVRFEQGAHAIDVVPATFETFLTDKRTPLYLIPDGNGGWKRTSPEPQKAYLDREHSRSGNKLKALVRMLKWWGGARGSTSSITSLYLEHLVAACQISLGLTYQHALARIFAIMAESRCPPLRDPTGISDPFNVTRTRLQHAAVITAAQISADRAARALHAETRGRDDLAIRLWTSVFNGSFPSRLF
jgi:hypothetical protein